MTNQKPAHEVRLGKVKAAIWAKQTEKGTLFNVSCSRLYKDGDAWRFSDNFGRDDLLLLAKVLDRAHSWIFDHEKQAE